MSKGLEATKRLKWGYAITHEERINLCECIEKELKALEIIKNKKVNVGWFVKKTNINAYNSNCYKQLTQEEFDLLQEVLL